MPVVHRNHVPSWARGFARRKSQAKYPSLWDGLVGLWAPSLGPTYDKLFDVSGYGNHGTLTGMDPATDWVTTSQRGIPWALDFDGDNDHVTTACPGVLGTAARSMFAWIKFSDSGNTVPIIAYGGAGSGREWLFAFRNGYLGLDGYNCWVYYNPALHDNTWHHVGLVMEAGSQIGQIKFYADGKLLTSVQSSVNTTYAINTLGTLPVVIAQSERSPERIIQAQLTNISIHNRTFIPSEIQQLHPQPNDHLSLRPRVFPTAVAGVTGNRRRRMILFGASA